MTPSPPNLDAFYPVLYSDDVPAAAAFYRTYFAFVPTFESDWYVSLVHTEKPAYQLAIIARDHDTIPAAFRSAASRLLLNIEVLDATAEHARLTAAGVDPVQSLRDEPFGQRHFILAAPDGVLIDVIQNIPPDPEFAAGFVSSEP